MTKLGLLQQLKISAGFASKKEASTYLGDRNLNFLNFGDLIENPLRSLTLKISQRLFVANVVSEMSEGERNP